MRQRSHGIVHLRAEAIGGATRVRDLSESGPLRMRFPRSSAGACEAILVNTAGGLACGDVFETSVALQARAQLVLTTTAAEKVYRSDGAVTRLVNRVELGQGAGLDWLPQETILFDEARLDRRFEADLAADARLLVAEIVVFGRAAHGETLSGGRFRDVWRIRRAGRLVYADTLHLDGPIGQMLARSAIGGGARACATIVDVSPAAEARLEEARALLDTAGADSIEAGASAWNGQLVIRALAADAGRLRRVVARFLSAYRGAPMPRVWQT